MRQVAEETDDAMDQAADALRKYAGVWRALTWRMGLDDRNMAGCFAKRLCVVLTVTGKEALIPETTEDIEGLADRIKTVLRKWHGMSETLIQGAARRAATAMTRENCSALLAARRVLRGDAGPSVRVLVLRVSIRSLKCMTTHDEDAVFDRTHANALVIRPGSMTVLEPMGPAPMQRVLDALGRVLAPHTTLVSRSLRHPPPLARTSLCTLAAAVLVLTVLANPDHATSQEGLDQLTAWVNSHQHYLLRCITASINSTALSP